MFKRLVYALSALSLALAGAQPVEAVGTYKGYYYGAKSPQEIARLVEASLAKDPTGKTMLSEDNCRTRGGCARPIDYLVSFKAHDPDGAPKNLSELSTYLRKLVIKHGLKGTYQMDLIVYSGTVHYAKVSGMSREFIAATNEAAWVNPETGRPVLAENCSNPVGMRIDISCVIVNFENREVNEYAVAWARYNRADDECFAYRQVTRSEELDTKTAVWNTIQPGCLGRPCNFNDVNRVVGREPKSYGLIPLKQPGFYQIRMSPDEFLVLCLKLRQGVVQNGQTILGSFASGVRWQQDYRLVGSQWHARVRYSSSDVRAAGLALNKPRGLTFWAANGQDEAAMRGLAFSK